MEAPGCLVMKQLNFFEKVGTLTEARKKATDHTNSPAAVLRISLLLDYVKNSD